jgi:hypothetical protein
MTEDSNLEPGNYARARVCVCLSVLDLTLLEFLPHKNGVGSRAPYICVIHALLCSIYCQIVLNLRDGQIFHHSPLLSKTILKCPGSTLCRQRSWRK